MELIQALAQYTGWQGYASLRATSTYLRACLPWREAYRQGRSRTVSLRELSWEHGWFEQHLTMDCKVQGTWVLDGFHGVIFLMDLDNHHVLGEGMCARGVLEGALVVHHPWRGGTSLMEIFREGRPHRASPRKAK